MDFAAARETMVDTQIRPRDVTDPAIHTALSIVPREIFVPEADHVRAYGEVDIETMRGRWLWRPELFARALQAAEIFPEDEVLDVAPGTGYSTAILGRLAARVTGLEPDENAVSDTNARLRQADAGSAHVLVGELAAGLPDLAPFDLIWVNGAVAEIPGAWLEQLAPGGRLLAPVATPTGLAHLRVFVNGTAGVAARTVFEAAVPALPGFEPRATFRF